MITFNDSNIPGNINTCSQQNRNNPVRFKISVNGGGVNSLFKGVFLKFSGAAGCFKIQQTFLWYSYGESFIVAVDLDK